MRLASGGTPEAPLEPYQGSFDVAPYQVPVGVPVGPEMLQAPNPSLNETAAPLPLSALKLRAPGSEPGPLVTTGPFAYPTDATADDIYGSGQEGALQRFGVPNWGPMPQVKAKKGKKLSKQDQAAQESMTKIATIARGTATNIAEQQQKYAANAVLAAHHSPIASMGLDLRHMRIFKNMGDMTGRVGEYVPPGGKDPSLPVRQDEMAVDPDYPSAAVHESVHRGLQMLRDSYPDRFAKIVGDSKMPVVEEYMVRGIEQKVFGNIEPSEDVLALAKNHPGVPTVAAEGAGQIELGKSLMPEYAPVIDKLEKLAQRHIATVRPGGPR